MTELQYRIACSAMRDSFPSFKAHLQELLKEQVMNKTDFEEIKVIQTKFNYLIELEQLISNEGV